MRYCYACGHTTGGEPLFCNFCGRSYDVKLCPKLHANARLAEACSQCGSRDLSTPQPRVPFSWRLLSVLAQVSSGLLLVGLSVPILIQLLPKLLMHFPIPDRLFFGGVLLIVLWSLWAVLPDYCRRTMHRSLTRKSGSLDSRGPA